MKTHRIIRVVGGAFGAMAVTAALALPAQAGAVTTGAGARPAQERGGGCSEAHRRIIRSGFEAWSDGTGSITDVFHPAIVWRIEGRTVVSKTYHGKKSLLDEVMLPFGARFNLSREPFRPTNVEAIYCEGDTTAVHWHGTGVANNGMRYTNSYVWIMTLRRGKVVSGIAFLDSISFNELWRNVPPSTA
ncbi:hypothetical protein DP939_17585 [Spongiactinospora rosea]|uniref:SnoaL-like domain-containing protein n=1 Tax=Spongiactinospora rosea TaxID=2248750 RepID=A0A366LYH5_9ACTN|nr:nuclear transport factor 2 family protein [Spongiactinospora rosea]RBQ18995.1 hypothetical protein DP939_17585 [Spongiactinospora rosea]